MSIGLGWDLVRILMTDSAGAHSHLLNGNLDTREDSDHDEQTFLVVKLLHSTPQFLHLLMDLLTICVPSVSRLTPLIFTSLCSFLLSTDLLSDLLLRGLVG